MWSAHGLQAYAWKVKWVTSCGLRMSRRASPLWARTVRNRCVCMRACAHTCASRVACTVSAQRMTWPPHMQACHTASCGGGACRRLRAARCSRARWSRLHALCNVAGVGTRAPLRTRPCIRACTRAQASGSCPACMHAYIHSCMRVVCTWLRAGVGGSGVPMHRARGGSKQVHLQSRRTFQRRVHAVRHLGLGVVPDKGA